jgi:peptidoglycan/LPS O-acetylase OafA/YrhL
MAKTQMFRSDINWLRFLAVIAVIAYHVSPLLVPVGFLGVDVFFVVSGYLVSGQILARLNEERFSFKDFYLRRVRRLAPALFFLVLFTNVLVICLAYEEYTASVVESSFYVLASISNIFFWLSTGYFDPIVDLSPYIHTWSLGVEEQFYLVFPVVLFLIWRFFSLKPALVLIFASSFLLWVYGLDVFPSATFYLLPTRIWQFSLGALAFVYGAQLSRVPAKSFFQVLSGFSLAILLFWPHAYSQSQFLYQAAVSFLATAFILMGTGCFVLSRFFDFSVFRLIGLSSYSQYLYHQPALALSRYFHGTSFSLLSSLGVSVVLGFLSYRYIESYFRYSCRKLILWSTLVSIFIVVLLQFKFFYLDVDVEPANDWGEVTCDRPTGNSFSTAVSRCIQFADGERDVVLIGDSHATQFSFILEKYFKSSASFNFLNPGRFDEFPYTLWSGEPVEESTVYQRLLSSVEKNDVVFITFHMGRFNKIRDKHQAGVSYPGQVLEATNQLEKFSETVLTKGAELYLILDTPLLGFSNFEFCEHRKDVDRHSRCSVSLSENKKTRASQEHIFTSVASAQDGVYVIDMDSVFYQDGVFDPVLSNNRSIMFDSHHFKKEGILLYYEELSKELNLVLDKY